jgi:hypothetical protein
MIALLSRASIPSGEAVPAASRSVSGPCHPVVEGILYSHGLRVVAMPNALRHCLQKVSALPLAFNYCNDMVKTRERQVGSDGSLTDESG